MFCVTLTEMSFSWYPEVTRIRYSPSMRRVKALSGAWYAEHEGNLPSFCIEIWGGRYNHSEPIHVEGQDFGECDWSRSDWNRYRQGMSADEVSQSTGLSDEHMERTRRERSMREHGQCQLCLMDDA